MESFTYREHGGVKMFNYKGLPTLQMVGVEKAFSKLTEYVALDPFRVIIELGSHYGGLTNLLADHTLSNYAHIHTFDIDPDKFVNYSPEQISFHNVNIYNNFDLIRDMIKQSGRALVLCDGGDKKTEFRTLAPILKPGDIIMAHDYLPDADCFESIQSTGRWYWWEFDDEAIPTCGLFKPLDCFDEYVWCIREKVAITV